MAIDYNRKGYNSNIPSYSIDRVFDRKNPLLKGVSDREMRNLQQQLFRQDAQYNDVTLQNANRLLTYLRDNGLNFRLKPRHDGKGVLAEIQGMGTSKIDVTVLAANDGNKDVSDFVGNISSGGRSFYTNSNNRRKPRANESPFDIIKAFTGQMAVEVQEDYRSNGGFDARYVVRDENGNEKFRFFRRKLRDDFVNVDLSGSGEGGYVEDLVDILSDEDAEVDMSPLEMMVYDTNRQIYELQDEDGYIERAVNGIQEIEKIEPIEIKDNFTFDGLDLDTLLKFNDRSEISKAIGIEMRMNEEFNLSSTEIKGELGLKNMLMEASAGINAERVDAHDLGNGYQEILDMTRADLQKMGIKVNDLYFDEDHVINWSGVEERAGRNGQTTAIEREGQIGQVFLPNETGIIQSKYKVLEGVEDDRNYTMVAGYAGYYTSAGKNTIKPLTVRGEDGKDYAADAYGNMIMVPDFKMEKERKERDPNGKPYTLAEISKPYLASEFTPKRIIDMNKYLDSINKKYGSNLQPVAYETREEELQDRLRLKGFDKAVSDKIKATIARQVLQSDIKPLDNIDLNKLYHGDVYSERLKDYQIARPIVVETKRGMVKFEDTVLDMDPKELGARIIGYDKNNEPQYEDITHRYNLNAHTAIFDQALTSDGAAIGLKRYLVRGAKVLEDGRVIPAENESARAPIYDEMYATEADPSDRSMMAANQNMRARAVEECNVVLMNYKGHTIEDGAVISQAFAERHDPPLKVGDKISDNHGNKATISYIASPETDEFFAENKDVDVIMNAYSVTGRKNMGVVLEMRDGGEVKEVTYKGKVVGEMAKTTIIVTDITADSKTKTYEDVYNEHGELVSKSPRKGRSYGAQEGWIGAALDTPGIMKEVYGSNNGSFDKLRHYMNVTGLDMDEDGIIYQGGGFEVDESGRPTGEIMEVSNKLKFPEKGGVMELPISVRLPGLTDIALENEDGTKSFEEGKSKYIAVLPEKYRKTQELFDGQRMYHEYSKGYARIAEASLDLIEVRDKMSEALGRDLSDVDFGKDKERLAIEHELNAKASTLDEKTAKKVSNLNLEMNTAVMRLESRVTGLTNQIIDEKLGGLGYTDEKGNFRKDTSAVKRSIAKTSIMGAQVDNSVTAVVTAYSDMDIDQIAVSPQIYEKLGLEDPEERVALWRDPALHDKSMVGFRVIVDERLTGVGFHPLVAAPLGLDYDGDQVAVWKPKTPEAIKDVNEKLDIGKRLTDHINGSFNGDVGLDFVASAIKTGYVGDNITQGPLVGRKDIKDMGPKDQLEMMVTEMANKPEGVKEISELWKNTVKSDANIGASKVLVSTREKTLESLIEHTEQQAKGKRDAVISKSEEMAQGMSFPQKVKNKVLPKVSTVMGNYDSGDYLLKQKKVVAESKNPAEVSKAQRILNWTFKPQIKKGGRDVDNEGSLALSYGLTRIASAQKAELTGQAGSKSQQLMVVAYDDPKAARAAMRVTEPLTQVVLKLKHDAARVQPTKKIIREVDNTLKSGGLRKDEFCDKLINAYKDGGLTIDREDTETVFDLLKHEVNGQEVTMEIKDAMEKKGKVLPKAGLNGFQAFKDAGRNNTLKLLNRVKTKDKVLTLDSVKDGYVSSRHVPDKLKEVTSPSRSKMLENIKGLDSEAPIRSRNDLSRHLEAKEDVQAITMAKDIKKDVKDPEVKRDMDNVEKKAQTQSTVNRQSPSKDKGLDDTLAAIRSAENRVDIKSARAKRKPKAKARKQRDDYGFEVGF